MHRAPDLTRRLPAPPADGIIAYETRVPGRIFVPVPGERNRYLLTDRCVALRACPQCGAAKGVPCIGAQGPHGGTHAVRRVRLGNAEPFSTPPDVIAAEDIDTTG